MEVSTLSKMLMDGFEYEAWANDQWAPLVPALGETGAKIWAHMLKTQTLWYSRCLGEEELPTLPEDIGAALREMSGHWRDLLRICDPEAYVSYTTTTGETYMSLLEDIARHVVNHGTYHRGQLRIIAEHEGIAFPETDLILWKRSLE